MTTETTHVVHDREGRVWQIRRRAGYLDWEGQAHDDLIVLIGPEGTAPAATELDSRPYIRDWLAERLDPDALEASLTLLQPVEQVAS
jgi:hypothetical protein